MVNFDTTAGVEIPRLPVFSSGISLTAGTDNDNNRAPDEVVTAFSLLRASLQSSSEFSKVMKCEFCCAFD